MDPKPGEQAHGEVYHLCGLGNHDRLAFEAPKPMPLAAVIPLHVVRGRFALHEFVLGDDRRRGAPLVGPVPCDIPSCQTIDPLLQRGLVTPSAFPVPELSSVPIQRFPTPELQAFLLEIMPHLMDMPLKYHRTAWLFVARSWPRGESW
jgi:hypothetical protein